MQQSTFSEGDMRPLNLRLKGRSLLWPLSSIASAIRFAYSFDGVDDRGQLAFRAINPDGDNTFEFWTPENFLAERAIVAQSISGNFSLMEFRLFARTTPDLVITFGGATNIFFTAAQGLKPATKYGLTLIGNRLRLFEGGLAGALVRDITFTRGAAREPAAVTTIGSRISDGSPTNFFRGVQRDIKINETLWPISERNQSIQIPVPSGLGANILNINNINWDSSATNRYTSGDEFGYTAIDSWGQRSFRIPVTIESDMHYLLDVEVLSGFNEGELVRVTLNDKLGDGAPHVIPVSLSAGVVTPFDASSTHYGSYRDFGRVTNGRLRGVFMIPAATNLNWHVGLRLQGNQNGRVVRLKGLSIKPLWTAKATSVIANGDFSSGSTGWAAHNGAAINVVSGRAVLSTVAGQPSRMERGTLALTPGKYYVASVNIIARDVVTRASLSIIRGAAGNYQSIASVQTTALGRVSLVFLAPSSDALIQIYGDSTNAGSVTVDDISLRELDSLCNPLTLVNTNPDRWQDASYLPAFSFNDPRNTQFLPLL